MILLCMQARLCAYRHAFVHAGTVFNGSKRHLTGKMRGSIPVIRQCPQHGRNPADVGGHARRSPNAHPSAWENGPKSSAFHQPSPPLYLVVPHTVQPTCQTVIAHQKPRSPPIFRRNLSTPSGLTPLGIAAKPCPSGFRNAPPGGSKSGAGHAKATTGGIARRPLHAGSPSRNSVMHMRSAGSLSARWESSGSCQNPAAAGRRMPNGHVRLPLCSAQAQNIS